MVTVAVVGSRTFNDYILLCKTLDQYTIKKIVSGGAKGADSLAELYAKKKNIETIIFYPDWNKYGRAAGPIRNKLIVSASDIVIAFWDGKSKGTASSIGLAKKIKKKLIVVRYD